jgi:hypothetical protein
MSAFARHHCSRIKKSELVKVAEMLIARKSGEKNGTSEKLCVGFERCSRSFVGEDNRDINCLFV